MSYVQLFKSFIQHPKKGFWFPFRCRVPFIIKTKGTIILYSPLVIGAKKGTESIWGKFLFIQKEGSIATFGKNIYIGSDVEIFLKQGSNFEIGENTYFTGRSHIECENEIRIGNNCAISWGCTIIDSDHHMLYYDNKREKSNSVRIGNNVWIGCNSTILKGTVIGNGSVVAAGSIVSGNFPEKALIGGSPAKIIKENIEWEK